MQPISDDMLTTSKICIVITMCEWAIKPIWLMKIDYTWQAFEFEGVAWNSLEEFEIVFILWANNDDITGGFLINTAF